MTTIRAWIGRLPVDPYLLLLIATVALAALLPAHGEGRVIADAAVTIAVATLFFLYGARLSPAAVWTGIAHWRLQSLTFASTFLLFPVIGLAVGTIMRPYLPHDILVGLVYLCLLPSTVQSSIAFTSIARGNVPAALCSASVSNLAGVFLTPLLVSLLLPAAGVGFFAQALRDIAMQILVPFVAGQSRGRGSAAWLLRHPLLTAVVDRGRYCLSSMRRSARAWWRRVVRAFGRRSGVVSC